MGNDTAAPLATPETESPDAQPGKPDGSFGAWMFNKRGLVHPVFVVAALLTAGPDPELRTLALVLMAVYVFLRLWAASHIGGAARVHSKKSRKKRTLITTGPFSIVRNPLYVANAAGLVGSCLLLGTPWLAAVSAVVVVIWYVVIVGWEAGVLEDLYGDEYVEYRKRVGGMFPRPRLRLPAFADLGQANLSLKKVLRKERGMLMIAAFMLALGWLRVYLAS